MEGVPSAQTCVDTTENSNLSGGDDLFGDVVVSEVDASDASDAPVDNSVEDESTTEEFIPAPAVVYSDDGADYSDSDAVVQDDEDDSADYSDSDEGDQDNEDNNPAGVAFEDVFKDVVDSPDGDSDEGDQDGGVAFEVDFKDVVDSPDGDAPSDVCAPVDDASFSASSSAGASSSESVRVLVVGDTHFKHKYIREGEAFVAACVAAAKTLAPDLIVCLGDTLDTHEIVHVQPHNLACAFLKQLSEVAHTYLLIGNHDLINHKQYLTENHVFNPMKQWQNFTVVDKPHVALYGDSTFVMCPYVPNGKFTAALDTLLSPNSRFHWQVDADCVFAHQEFRGCTKGGAASTDGDRWPSENPPVISGHIHEAHDLGGNVFYSGSVMQHSFGESKPKRLWLVTFDRRRFDPFHRQYIDLGLTRKTVIEMPVAEVCATFRYGWLADAHVKLKVSGTSEEFRLFRRSPMYADLVARGVRVAFAPDADPAADGPTSAFVAENGDPRRAYREILTALVRQTAPTIREHVLAAYEELAAEDRMIEEAAPTTLVFDVAK
uniref:DNA repair exonuclease n=1 Tax=Marseillevirus LCMAC103 TaxID=2506604 RepID=A0A481YTR0_9VIRU|nr:MAG: DNA repair exonuclease [Marseillevirus LCMAC103]